MQIYFAPRYASFSSLPFGGAVFEHEENKSARWQGLLLIVVLTFLCGGGIFITRLVFFFFLLRAV
jgi:hypothetical protein